MDRQGENELVSKQDVNAHQERQSAPQDSNRDRGLKGSKRKRDIGRVEFSRQKGNKRLRNDEEQEKRRLRDLEGSSGPSKYPAFSKEEIAQEERKPKRKVAVLIGYSGSGYLGMQLSSHGKSIEGDLFNAFVAAGAISKANADDPKKSSLVRCARTDKGVHAAGNVISLKLIVEDEDIVEKINHHLSPQIRVWGFIRTTGSFNCYQSCDSRIYEYLIPTHAFLPPHPRSYLGKKLLEIAQLEEDLDGFQSRQREVAEFWDDTEVAVVTPMLANLDTETRDEVLRVLFEPTVKSVRPHDDDISQQSKDNRFGELSDKPNESNGTDIDHGDLDSRKLTQESVRLVKAALLDAKKKFRLPSDRLQRIRDAQSLFLGTRNFYNYTVQKSSKDPSAKRNIKSFVASEPIMISGTEWLSLKIHGQSFMMHQIRKMIAMIVLVVRAGCLLERISESFQKYMSIPKLPGLGLLLERPVFESYNANVASKHEKGSIEFDEYKEQIDSFKQREIYDRIFREEEETNQFHQWFQHIDISKAQWSLYLSSGGVSAVAKSSENDLELIPSPDSPVSDDGSS